MTHQAITTKYVGRDNPLDTPYDPEALRREAEELKAHPFVPPRQRKRPAPRPDRNWRAPIEDSIKPWMGRLDSKAIAKAEASLHKALDEATRAADSVQALPNDQADERDQVARTAAEDAKSGGSTVIVRTDWEYEESRRGAAWLESHNVALAARDDYLRVVGVEAPALLGNLVDKAQAARAKALPLAKEVATAVREAARAVRDVKQADAALKIFKPGWHETTPENKALAGAALAGMQAVLALLESADAVVTGEYALDHSASVPLHTRDAMYASSSPNSFRLLLQIEGDEGWSVTQHTAAYKSLYRGQDQGLKASINKKDFAL